MNENIFAGRWREMRGSLRSWWGRLTDDDLERIGGEKDRLVGVIQEKYGHTREESEREVDRRFSEYGAGGIASNLKSKVDSLGASVSGKASEAASAMTESVQSARSYYQDHTFDELTADIAAWVRRYPIQACLIGIGVGYLIARSVSGSRDRARFE